MNVISRFRRLGRAWHLGLAVAAMLGVAFTFAALYGRHGNQTQTTFARSATSAAGSDASAIPATGSAAAAPTSASVRRVPLPAETTAAAPAIAAGRSSSGSGATSDAANLSTPFPVQVIDQKIVRTAAVQITVQDVAGVERSIWNLAEELRGNVLTSNRSGTGDSSRSEVVFRVPADRYQDAIDRIHRFAVKVEKEQSSAQDVTEEYVDLQARQRNLEATVLQFQALLAKATTIDEKLKVQAHLNNAQSDLERIKGRLNYYDQRSAYSTISVTILPLPPPAKPAPVTPVAKWSLSLSVREAWNRSVNCLQVVVDALITVIFGGWWIEIPLGLLLYYLARRDRRRRPVPAAAAPIANEESGTKAGK